MDEITTTLMRTLRETGSVHIASWDPGYASGVAYGRLTPDEPLSDMLYRVLLYPELLREAHRAGPRRDTEFALIERFQLRTNNNFAADLTGVKVEGILEALNPGGVISRSRADKVQVPDEVLKEHGLWVTGRDLDWTDGRDANDATKHLLGFVAFTLGHRPTLRKYFR